MEKRVFIIVITLAAFMCFQAKALNTKDSLSGSWELTYISGPKMALKGLFPNKIPFLHIQEKDKKVNGNAGCNNFSGAVSIHKDSIAFNKPMAMSMMACNGKGEDLFVKALKEVTLYKFEKGDLIFYNNKTVLMRFKRKQ